MAIFGGEKKRIKEADNSYAQKYPLSNTIPSLQSSLNLANVELVKLKNDRPETSGGKRVRQRNITALSNRVMQLQNKIKDLQSGLSGSQILSITAPSLMKISDITSQKILNTTPYSFQIPTYNYPTNEKLLVAPKYTFAPAKTTDARDLADSLESTQGVPVDGGMGAQGDYPPPYGVQGSNTKSILLYGGLAAVLGFTAYYMFIKKK
jgi:hypothetical protein